MCGFFLRLSKFLNNGYVNGLGVVVVFLWFWNKRMKVKMMIMFIKIIDRGIGSIEDICNILLVDKFCF